MKLKNIPYWLKKGDLFNTFSENNSKLPNNLKEFITDSPEINSLEDFERVYNISHYWMLFRLPVEIYVYTFLNKKEILHFLEKLETVESKNLLDDIKNNKSFIKYKNIILEEYKDPEILEFYNDIGFTFKIDDELTGEVEYSDKIDTENEDFIGVTFCFNFKTIDEIILKHEIFMRHNEYDNNLKKFEDFLKNLKNDKSDYLNFYGTEETSSTRIFFKNEYLSFNTHYSDIDGTDGDTTFKVKINEKIIEAFEKMIKFIKINKLYKK